MIDDLISTLEVVRDAVWARDKEKAFESVTIFLLQFMDVFGHSSSFMSKMFPILEELKDQIQAGDFDEANSGVLALLVRLRQVRESMSASKE
ncbi:MAG: hypothetical protein WCA19_27180 [Candidatus Acidiferrales bacterium]